MYFVYFCLNLKRPKKTHLTLLLLTVGSMSIGYKITSYIIFKKQHASQTCMVHLQASKKGKYKVAVFTQQKKTTKHILHVFYF
jgi:hypothetical protein